MVGHNCIGELNSKNNKNKKFHRLLFYIDIAVVKSTDVRHPVSILIWIFFFVFLCKIKMKCIIKIY